MVRIDRVTTRGGDGGDTSLGDGTRVRKDALRIEAIGSVDEANSAIGVLRVGDARRSGCRRDAGAHPARSVRCWRRSVRAGRRRRPAARDDTLTVRLEHEAAAMNATLPAFEELRAAGRQCGGGTCACRARAVVRRAERCVVALADAETINPAVVRYLNRLSDHLFVLARRLNAAADGDVLWTPGLNR